VTSKSTPDQTRFIARYSQVEAAASNQQVASSMASIRPAQVGSREAMASAGAFSLTRALQGGACHIPLVT